MNNVLYTLESPIACLREVYRVLKPGGEIRITGPKKSTRLAKLFRQIEKDLRDRRAFDDLEADFKLVKRINEQQLSPHLYKWGIDEVEKLLKDAGFEKPYFSSEKVYAGQGLIVCARK